MAAVEHGAPPAPTAPRVWPGRPYPLGATWDGAGVNFALFSEHAEGVELCLCPDGTEMTEAQWQEGDRHALGFRLCGQAMEDVDDRGQPITDDTLLVLMNAQSSSVPFVLPSAEPGVAWERLLDTARDDGPGEGILKAHDTLPLAGRSLVFLRAIGGRERP
jgi:pullulanase/glycogen debranching enzyme